VAGRYESVFDGGRNDLRLKNSIDLPSSTDTVLSATWPDSASLPTTSGAFVSKNPLTGRVDGGIVINGNAQEVNLRLDKYGNQHTVIKQGLAVGSDTKLTENTTKTPYTPKKMGTCGGGCNKWGPPPTGGGGGGGVGGGGAATGSAPCIGWSATYPCEQFQYIPNGTFSSSTSTDDDQFTTEIFEVIEPQAITAADAGLVGTPKPSGTGNFVASDVVATEGQTLVIRKAQIQATDDTDKTYFGTTIARPASGSVTKVVQVEVLDGQINGNIYATGRIGGAESQRHGDTERGVEAVGTVGHRQRLRRGRPGHRRLRARL
jgi:hypothetical protein